MIINSLLDTDIYKAFLGQIAFAQFPKAIARYRFFNRNQTPFPPDFFVIVQEEINKLATVHLTEDEYKWLQQFKYFDPRFLEWFRDYRFNPKEVTVTQNGTNLDIEINGPWHRSIYWEIPLMAIISQSFFRDKQPDKEWKTRIKLKADVLTKNGVKWSDFGTRRRFSYEVQDEVVRQMSEYPGFLGTSNPHLAMKYGVRPIGTTAHEGPQAMQALYGAARSNVGWMNSWISQYRGELGIALTDTLTTAVFLRDFDSYYARVFDGVRQDSGNTFAWGAEIIKHYQSLGIDPHSKTLVFSDGLTTEKVIRIHEAFHKECNLVFGIGTHLSNHVGVEPLNMVIKLVGADFGQGMKEVIKLSDSEGKYTGNPEVIASVKKELGLVEKEPLNV